MMDMTTYKGFYKVQDVPTSHWDNHGNWIINDWLITHPCLSVWIEDEEGDQVAFETADMPADWDGEDPAEYDRLERLAAEQIGADWESISWELA